MGEDKELNGDSDRLPPVRDRLVPGARRHVLEPIFETEFAEPSLEAMVADVHQTWRGWYGYFQHSQANVFADVDGFVRRRLRRLRQWRRDGRGRGIGRAHHRWPNEWFAQRGLLRLAAEHDWTRTIVALRTH